jgi:hypothetical protein
MNTKIATKMAAAMKDIDAVSKNGKNDIQKYSYVKSADVAHEARKALATHGIAFSYNVLEERHWDSVTKSGSNQFFCSLKVSCEFTDSESGESVNSTAIGWGSDTGDKAPYKAMTGALKYLLRMTFLIPDEAGDPENPDHEPEQSRPQVKPVSQFNRQAAASIEEDDLSFLNDDRHPSEYSQEPERQVVSPVKQAHSVGSVKAISPAQVKRLWAIAKQRNMSSEAVLRIVGAAGYETVDQIGWKSYEGIIDQIQGAA